MVSYIWLYHIPMIFPHYTHSPIEFLVKSPSFAQESAGSPMNLGSGNDSPTCLGHDLQYVGRCTKKHGTWPRYFIFMEYIYIYPLYIPLTMDWWEKLQDTPDSPIFHGKSIVSGKFPWNQSIEEWEWGNRMELHGASWDFMGLDEDFMLRRTYGNTTGYVLGYVRYMISYNDTCIYII